MKRYLLFLLVCATVLTGIPFNVNAADGMPTADDLDGYENICLTYTFDYYNSKGNKGAHSVEDLLPYVGYYDRNSELKDYFFDSYLFLPCVSFGPSGGSMVGSFAEPSNLLDWTSYVNDTFKDGYNVDALNTAFGQVKKELGDTSDRKAGVFFTILYPVNTQEDFGNINGKNLDFTNVEDRKTAIKWIIDEQIALYTEGNYENLDMVGFYWFEEYLYKYDYTEEDIELFNFTADYLHSLGLKFIWIPWYMAYGADRWEELGFDVACMQPNLFWMSDPDYERVEASIEFSEKHGLCMEMEVDPLAFYSEEHLKRYFIYLEDGMNFGAMDSIKMYYQEKNPATFYQACYSNEFSRRIIYELTYKYAKGTLTQQDIEKARNGVYPDADNVENKGNKGDINADGVIDTYDYMLCKRIYFHTYEPNNDEFLRADVDGNNLVDTYDCMLIIRHYFGTYAIE